MGGLKWQWSINCHLLPLELLCFLVLLLCWSWFTPMYDDCAINNLQNGTILLIFKIWNIRNIGFVHNFILSSSCEFYYDDVTVTSFINDKYGDTTTKASHKRNSVLLLILCGQKDFGQMPFTERYVQYMVTSVLQDQQYMFGVRSL